MSETPRGHTNDACCSCCYEVNRLQRENTELRAENANLRESAETATFVANNMSESWRTEVERREDAQLHGDAARAEADRWKNSAEEQASYRAASDAEVDRLREGLKRLRDGHFRSCPQDYPHTWCAEPHEIAAILDGQASNEEQRAPIPRMPRDPEIINQRRASDA